MKSLFILLLFFSVAGRAETCASLFAASPDPTPQFISYLDSLIEIGAISPSDVASFAETLTTSGGIENPIRSTSSTYRIHAREIEVYIRSGTLDPALLTEWAHEKSRANQIARAQRAEASRTTQRRQMNFVRFTVGEPKYEIEVMDTLVTQGMWLDLMGENPSHFKASGLDAPVENVSWYSAAIFANRLSKRKGLKPYYDFDESACGGLAERGDLRMHVGILQCLKKQFEKTSDADGYRLPNQSEFLPVAFPVRHTAGAAIWEIDRHAWLAKNAGGQTHGVAGLDALPGLPAEVFDVYGNVHEWAHAWDPSASVGVSAFVYVQGGGFKSGDYILNEGRALRDPAEPLPDIGFRLVRTLRR